MRREAVIIGALVWSAGIAAAGAVRIRVVDETGLAVAGAEVRARHVVSGQGGVCRSDEQGRCEQQLPPGRYLVEATTEQLEGREAVMVTGQGGEAQVEMRNRPLRASVTVVSSGRSEELQEESATKVEAVSREQMLQTGYERVSDVVQEIPGVVVRRGSTATVGGEQIQGIDSRQVLVLQDGLPVVGARGIKSGVVNLNRQTADRLSRVEVAKGAGSATYGSDAIGGVINLITREPESELEGGGSISGGSLGMRDIRADVGGRRGRGSYFFNVGDSRLDSYQLIPNSVTTVGPETRRQDGLGKARIQLHPKLLVGVTANGYRNRDRGRNLSETGAVSGVTNDSMQSYAVVADWIVDSATTVQWRGYLARYDENNTTALLTRPEVVSVANLNERLRRLDGTVSRAAGRGHFVQGGVEWNQTLYRGANRLVGDNAGQQVRATDIWVQDKWVVNGRLTLTAGGRVTAHSLFGDAAVPKAGVIVKLSERWIARGSFGLGFRAPDLGQLYFRFANPASFYQVIGNPTLRPEHSRTLQTGLVYRQQRYRLGLTLFRNDVRDLIDAPLAGTPRTAAELEAMLRWYGVPEFFEPLVNRQTFIYRNQSRILTQGVEVDGEYAATRNLRFSGGYTFLQAVDVTTRLGLPQRHRHHGQTRVDYFVPKTGITANLRTTFFSHWLVNAAAGTRGLPYQVVDLYVGKDWRRGVASFMAIDNLNDSRDGKLRLPAPTFDRPDYGRTVRVGLRWRLRRGE